MDALVLFAHGSLLCGAGETLEEHAARLRERGEFAIVEVGYLNYSEPTFAAAVSRCATLGADRIVVVPYFLVPGKFVRTDLPARIAACREARPELEFVVAEPIGYHAGLARAVLDLTAGARSCERWRDDLRRAARYCEGDATCPLFGTHGCPRGQGEAAEVGA